MKQKPRRTGKDWKIDKEEMNLPRVLLIGDSISIGYTLRVRELLRGKANVHRPCPRHTKGTFNCGDTNAGLTYLDYWLGEKKWDLIHFNWGLHDLKYTTENGRKALPPKGHQQVPPAEYRKNLQKLVGKLKKTEAKLIFANTTPVPEGAAGRIPEDVGKYNRIAGKVMKEHGVWVNDLYSFILPHIQKVQRPRNVHFEAEGYDMLAKKVADSIISKLTE